MKSIKEHLAVKSILGIVLLLLTFSVVFSWIGHNQFTKALISQYSDEVYTTAKAAAQIVDGDEMDSYVEGGASTTDYKYANYQLDRLCNASGSTFVYVIQPDLSDYGHITFIFSTVNHYTEYSPYELGFVKDTTNDDYREKYRRIYEGGSKRELVIRDKGFIETESHITEMVPVLTDDEKVKGIICVQRQMENLVHVRKEFFAHVAIAMAVGVVLTILAISLFINNTILRPMRAISAETRRFSLENSVSEQKLYEVVKRRDEFGQLAGDIDRMEEQIHQYVDNLMKVTAEKERIGAELSVATQIQKDMLPRNFPAFPDRKEFDIYASMTPAKEVGGDFYDFFLIDDDRLAIVMADVSGKGVPAALFMVVAKTLIKNTAQLENISPARILYEVNNKLCEGNEAALFVTVWLAVLNLKTGKGIASNAGHEHPVVKRSGEAYQLVEYHHSPAVAVLEDMVFEEHEFEFYPGDTLFVYTDGLPEATDARNELYGTDRMLEALNSDMDAPPQEILENVNRSVSAFVGEAPQFDDLTMLCLRYLG